MILGLDIDYYFNSKSIEWAKLMMGNNVDELLNNISCININKIFMARVELNNYLYNLVLANIDTGDVYATFSIVDVEKVQSNILANYTTKFRFEENDGIITKIIIPNEYYLINNDFKPSLYKTIDNLIDLYKEIRLNTIPYAYMPNYIK